MRSEAERLLAMRLAEGVPGVRRVANDLKPLEAGTWLGRQRSLPGPVQSFVRAGAAGAT